MPKPSAVQSVVLIAKRTAEALVRLDRIEVRMTRAGAWRLTAPTRRPRFFQTFLAAEKAAELAHGCYEWGWVKDGHYIVIDDIPGPGVNGAIKVPQAPRA